MKRLLLLMALALLPLATAHDEADAPLLRSDVEAVWHTPQTPAPGAQWQGFIRFHEGHDITAVRYQACRVPDACFYQADVPRLDNNTWGFDTADHQPLVRWGVNDGDDGDWRVGVQFFLTTSDGTLHEFPEGIPVDDPRCASDGELGYAACAETHYLAWDMPASSPDKGAPAPPWWPAMLLLAFLARRSRR